MIANREVSSTELTELYLARIEEIDPQAQCLCDGYAGDSA